MNGFCEQANCTVKCATTCAYRELTKSTHPLRSPGPSGAAFKDARAGHDGVREDARERRNGISAARFRIVGQDLSKVQDRTRAVLTCRESPRGVNSGDTCSIRSRFSDNCAARCSELVLCRLQQVKFALVRSTEGACSLRRGLLHAIKFSKARTTFPGLAVNSGNFCDGKGSLLLSRQGRKRPRGSALVQSLIRDVCLRFRIDADLTTDLRGR
jgi:hypothetical protein